MRPSGNRSAWPGKSLAEQATPPTGHRGRATELIPPISDDVRVARLARMMVSRSDSLRLHCRANCVAAVAHIGGTDLGAHLGYAAVCGRC